MDPRDFKVFDEDQSEELNLSVALKDQPYFICCQNSGTTPSLYLVSTIFRNAQQLERENRVRTALRQQGNMER